MNHERSVDLGFVCLGVALVLTATYSYLKESRPEVFPARSELPAAYPRSAGRGQVVLAFRSDCHYCIQSVPFYKRLATYSRRVGFDFRATPEPPEVVRAVMKAEEGDNVAIMRVADFDFPGTPALVFVDARNHVVASWLGWLSSTLEDEVIAAIEELAR